MSLELSLVFICGTDLDIVLGKLLSKRTTATGGRVDRVVDGDLAVFMIQPSVDVLTALLENLLAEDDGRRGGVGEEVVFRNHTTGADGGSAVVTKMKDASLDAEPGGYDQPTSSSGMGVHSPS